MLARQLLSVLFPLRLVCAATRPVPDSWASHLLADRRTESGIQIVMKNNSFTGKLPPSWAMINFTALSLEENELTGSTFLDVMDLMQV